MASEARIKVRGWAGQKGVCTRSRPSTGGISEQNAAVLFGRLGKLADERFDLLTSGVFEGFCAAEVDGVGFHQFRIELVPADDLQSRARSL